MVSMVMVGVFTALKNTLQFKQMKRGNTNENSVVQKTLERGFYYIFCNTIGITSEPVRTGGMITPITPLMYIQQECCIKTDF